MEQLQQELIFDFYLFLFCHQLLVHFLFLLSFSVFLLQVREISLYFLSFLLDSFLLFLSPSDSPPLVFFDFFFFLSSTTGVSTGVVLAVTTGALAVGAALSLLFPFPFFLSFFSSSTGGGATAVSVGLTAGDASPFFFFPC